MTRLVTVRRCPHCGKEIGLDIIAEGTDVKFTVKVENPERCSGCGNLWSEPPGENCHVTSLHRVHRVDVPEEKT